MPTKDSQRVYVPPARRSVNAWCEAVAAEIKTQHGEAVTNEEFDGLSDFMTIILQLGAKYLNAHEFDKAAAKK